MYDWTDERLARLKELWADFSVTTVDIGEILGCSKNAVIGKAHRLKLAKRPIYAFKAARSPVEASAPPPVVEEPPAPENAPAPAPAPPKAKPKREKKRERMSPPLAERPTFVIIPPSAKLSGPVDILGLSSRSCRWPLGEERAHPPYLYCGETSAEGLPYCPAHCARAYTGYHSPTSAARRFA